VGSRPTAPTSNLGDQDFLSGLSPLAFGVPTPLLQGNKICNPRQGPLQSAISQSQPNPGFFEVVTPRPPPFSTGLGTGYGRDPLYSLIYLVHTKQIITQYKYLTALFFRNIILNTEISNPQILIHKKPKFLLLASFTSYHKPDHSKSL
jgi:hypothetical protein